MFLVRNKSNYFFSVLQLIVLEQVQLIFKIKIIYFPKKKIDLNNDLLLFSTVFSICFSGSNFLYDLKTGCETGSHFTMGDTISVITFSVRKKLRFKNLK